jgi:hypothetical protein
MRFSLPPGLEGTAQVSQLDIEIYTFQNASKATTSGQKILHHKMIFIDGMVT